MREKGTNSPMLRGLEIIRDSFAAGRMLSPPRGPSRSRSSFDRQKDVAEERELSDICALGDKDNEEQENVTMELVQKEYCAAKLQPISSFVPRHGRNGIYAQSRANQSPSSVKEMVPVLSRVSSTPINWRPDSNSNMAASERRESSSHHRLNSFRKEFPGGQEGLRFQGRLQKQRSVWRSDPREEATDGAWERRRDRLLTVSRDNRDLARRSVGRSVSDCGPDRTWPALQRTSSRNRSLTDEDMDELRGCIDLGFGFSNDDKDMELCNTLPALELCYAITKQYNDVVGRSSPPISTSESNSSSRSFDRSRNGSNSLHNSPPPADSWRISSPGDHPSQVKTRLRHWAQAVACTVRQSC